MPHCAYKSNESTELKSFLENFKKSDIRIQDLLNSGTVVTEDDKMNILLDNLNTVQMLKILDEMKNIYLYAPNFDIANKLKSFLDSNIL